MKTLKFARLLICTFTLLSLSACSGDIANVNEDSPSSVATETPASLETAAPSNSEFKIPDDFPADIPLLEGELVLSSVAGKSPSQTWAIEVLVDNLDTARAETLAQLQTAGFRLIQETGVGTDTYEATLQRTDYTVMIKVYLEPETGELEVRYVVITRSN